MVAGGEMVRAFFTSGIINRMAPVGRKVVFDSNSGAPIKMVNTNKKSRRTESGIMFAGL
jgi:hypothetical protein